MVNPKCYFTNIEVNAINEESTKDIPSLRDVIGKANWASKIADQSSIEGALVESTTFLNQKIQDYPPTMSS